MSKAFTMIELIFVIVIITSLAVGYTADNNGTVCATQKQKGF